MLMLMFQFNIGEAVNFALPDWISYGFESSEEYLSHRRSPVFSIERLVVILSHRIIREMNDGMSLMELNCVYQHLASLLMTCRNERKLILSSSSIVRPEVVQLPLFFDDVMCSFNQSHADYDDVKSCSFCKCVCYFHAVVCDCSLTKVTCVRHMKMHCGLTRNGCYCSYVIQCRCEDDVRSLLNRLHSSICRKI